MMKATDSSSDLLSALKKADPVRYASVLYMPETKRPAVASLWLFQTEIERIRDLVSEPLPGEIRLQWWRDVLEGLRDGEATQNPLAVALLDTVENNGLRRDLFVAYVEAMAFDLYDDPMQDSDQFEGHMGETLSVFFQMICQILAGTPIPAGDAAGHAGVAFGVARCLVDMAKHRARTQIYVPGDMLAANGVTAEAWRAVDETAEKLQVVNTFASYGLDHLDKAKRAISNVPKECHPAFLPLAICGNILRQGYRTPSKVLAGSVAPGPLLMQWSILVAAVRGL
ncbi:MAG: phytoene/squalene synthase family protein [Pseudomonadota bacterium]